MITTGVLVVCCGFLGLLVGSFLNVVIWRVPRGESLVRPGSHCPACGADLQPRDNVPVVSWLLLRGRCRRCQAAISQRYPLVELLTAALFVVMALVIGSHLSLIAFLYLAAIGVALALIDLDVKRLPNAIIFPSYVVAAALLALAAIPGGEWSRLGRCVLAGCALRAFISLLARIKPGAMGWGDVRLAGILGLYLGWLGWGAVVVGGFAGFMFGGLGAVLLLLLRRANRKTHVPFGPYMLLGALFGITWGNAVADAYLSTMRG